MEWRTNRYASVHVCDLKPGIGLVVHAEERGGYSCTHPGDTESKVYDTLEEAQAALALSWKQQIQSLWDWTVGASHDWLTRSAPGSVIYSPATTYARLHPNDNTYIINMTSGHHTISVFGVKPQRLQDYRKITTAQDGLIHYLAGDVLKTLMTKLGGKLEST